jgi:hypothetical protein
MLGLQFCQLLHCTQKQKNKNKTKTNYQYTLTSDKLISPLKRRMGGFQSIAYMKCIYIVVNDLT